MWGISRRLTVSYVLVTLVVVVLVEAFVLGYQEPRLVSDAQLQAEVRGTAQQLLRPAHASAILAACRPEPCSATAASAPSPAPPRRRRMAAR